jgi:uncharacterized protein (DUF488 family)
VGIERTGAIGVGYEGSSLEQLITELTALEVTTLVDVRLNAISRKRGFSKRALADALNNAGITYLHRPELGNPHDNRAGFAEPWQTDEGRTARIRYAESIDTEKGRAAIDELAELATSQRIALLCFEASEMHCHRREALAAVRARRAARRRSARRDPG